MPGMMRLNRMNGGSISGGIVGQRSGRDSGEEIRRKQESRRRGVPAGKGPRELSLCVDALMADRWYVFY